jgi:hypothetical protein
MLTFFIFTFNFFLFDNNKYVAKSISIKLLIIIIIKAVKIVGKKSNDQKTQSYHIL